MSGHAWGQQIVNGDFEDQTPPLGSNSSFQYPKAAVPGWETTDALNKIEIWNNFGGFTAYSGERFAELNATSASVLSQTLTGVPAGSLVGFGWAHRGRQGTDVAEATVLDLGADGVAGTADDTVLFRQQASDGAAAWGYRRGTFVSPGRNVQLQFAAISAAGGLSVGNFLDAVELYVAARPDVIVAGTNQVNERQNLLLDLALTHDCRRFDAHDACISAGVRATSGNASLGGDGAGVLVAAFRPSATMRVGGFVETPGVGPDPRNFRYTERTPLVGAFLGYGVEGAAGLQMKAAIAARGGTLRYDREGDLATGVGSLNGWGAALDIGYGVAVAQWLAGPIAGLRLLNSTRGGYTESYASDRAEALTYERLSSRRTTGRFGFGVSGVVAERVGLKLAAGWEHDFLNRADNLIVVTPSGERLTFANPTRAKPDGVFGEAAVLYMPGANSEVRLAVSVRRVPGEGRYAQTAEIGVTKGF